MKGFVHGKPQDLRKGLGAGGDLPGGLNPYPEIIPAGRGLRQEGYRIISDHGTCAFRFARYYRAGMIEMQIELSVIAAGIRQRRIRQSPFGTFSARLPSG
jgi:hypothetical protein